MEHITKKQLIKEETRALADFRKMLKSPDLLKKKLIAELEDVGKKLSAIMDDKEKEKKKVFSKGGTSKPPSRTRQELIKKGPRS
jgi:hypothetical protein